MKHASLLCIFWRFMAGSPEAEEVREGGNSGVHCLCFVAGSPEAEEVSRACNSAVHCLRFTAGKSGAQEVRCRSVFGARLLDVSWRAARRLRR